MFTKPIYLDKDKVGPARPDEPCYHFESVIVYGRHAEAVKCMR